MTQTKKLKAEINYPSLIVKMSIGAVIAFGIAAFLVFTTDNPKPEWGNFWMVRPMIVLPFAGAVGGAFFYFMNPMREKGGVKMILANTISTLIFLIGMWMGIVLGFKGTLWN